MNEYATAMIFSHSPVTMPFQGPRPKPVLERRAKMFKYYA